MRFNFQYYQIREGGETDRERQRERERERESFPGQLERLL